MGNSFAFPGGTTDLNVLCSGKIGIGDQGYKDEMVIAMSIPLDSAKVKE
jgi:hypothetical protein